MCRSAIKAVIHSNACYAERESRREEQGRAAALPEQRSDERSGADAEAADAPVETDAAGTDRFGQTGRDQRFPRRFADLAQSVDDKRQPDPTIRDENQRQRKESEEDERQPDE